MSVSTFHILNFGCRASQADGAALKHQLLQAGLQEADSVESSTLAVLNTCTVTAAADAEVRQIVRRIHRQNPGCRILVTGCYAQRAPQDIARLEGVAWVVGNSHKHLVSEILAGKRTTDKCLVTSGEQEKQSDKRPVASDEQSTADALPGALVGISPVPGSQPPAPVVWVGQVTEEFHFAPAFADDRTRPTLKIQDGCDARCAFCIIPSVRGASRSLPPDKVLGQVRQLHDSGYHEIVLSGINLGGYGRDLDRSVTFQGIVERILRETSILRIRISSIEPMDVSPALIRLVATEPRLAQHFHVPLQSGCDRILRHMNRRYWARHYAERIFAIREQIPSAAIGADVMVGFPGETAQDHATSLRYIESLPYTYLHIFPFSARPGTPASAAPEQVNGRVARERSQEIRAVIDSKRQAFLAAQIGHSIPALTLDETEDGARVALTTNYLKIALPGCELPANTPIDVTIGRNVSGQLSGFVSAERLRC